MLGYDCGLRKYLVCSGIPGTIRRVKARDARYALKPGEGSDSVRTNPIYSYAVTLLHSDSWLTGTGLAITLGEGNSQICQLIETLAEPLAGRDIEQTMA